MKTGLSSSQAGIYLLIIVFVGNLLLFPRKISLQQSTRRSSASIHNLKPDDTFPTGPQSRIWTDYETDTQRETALQRVLQHVENLGNDIKRAQRFDPIKRYFKPKTKDCDLRGFGDGWGRHFLCDTDKFQGDDEACHFLSFGIQRDYSFDTQLADRWQCQGIAADPTVDYPSQLYEGVEFHKIGAATLIEESFMDDWTMVTLPAFLNNYTTSNTAMKAAKEGELQMVAPRVSILKMDCEGCEYGLARDVVTQDPDFFYRIDQFSVEIHLTRNWVNSDEELYYFGLLLELLQESGLQVRHGSITPCGDGHENLGCRQELHDRNFPCGWDSKLRGGFGRSCHNYLFARTATTTTTP